MDRNFAQLGAAFVALFALTVVVNGCGSDVGVSGPESVDIGSGGSDATLDDATAGDAITDGDAWIPGDTWSPGDIWFPGDGMIFPDTGPLGCVSDGNCPSSPCSKGVCDLSSHQCVAYTAPDGSYCGSGAGLCAGDGYCSAGQCISKVIHCDDGNPCTADSCDPSTGGCVFAAIPGCGGGCQMDAQCNDNNPCTQDYCDPKSGSCMHAGITGCGQPGCTSDAQCDDYNKCSIDKCQIGPNGAGICTHYGDLSQTGFCCDPNSQMMSCNDGNPCTSDYCGANFQCVYQGIPGCGMPGCKSDQDCYDGITCTIDKCQFDPTGMGQCTHTGDLNQKGICCDPNMNAMTCYDGNPCTSDFCDTKYQCEYQPIPGCGTPGCKSSADCNDGNACTQDMCFGGQCSYSGIACASPDPCTLASCDPQSGQCVYTPIFGCGNPGCKMDAQCDDGNPCSVDKCAISSAGGGQCYHSADLSQPNCCDPTSSKPSTCNDGNVCTQDTCGPDFMCQFIPTPGCVNKCKADSECTGGDVCTIAKCDLASGVCLYGSIPNCCNPAYCDDGNPCTKDSCDAATGGCTSTPIPGCVKPCDPTMCNDNNPCTTDLCDPTGNCQNIPVPNCAVQFCKSDPECTDTNPCTQDMCDLSTFTCQHYLMPGCGTTLCKTTADCNDFNACTGDLCLNNQCAHKTVTCDDGNPCTADQCLPTTGGCSNAPIPGCVATPCKTDAMCDDKNPCSIDTCVTGFCNHAYVPGCFPPP